MEKGIFTAWNFYLRKIRHAQLPNATNDHKNTSKPTTNFIRKISKLFKTEDKTIQDMW